jgi:hypothetical protein
MIKGLDKFNEYFSDFRGHYILIGGAASDLVLENAGIAFRATKDLDIVLCLEALDVDFAKAFWVFIKAGGYENQQRSSGKKIFYRFDHPQDDTFPFMLELFSRTPDTLVPGDDSQLTPIPVSDEITSLSAILLDNDYYQFIHQHKMEIQGVPVVSEACLIPLKAKAWLDLSDRVAAGGKVDSRDIKKHKNDVFRLFQIMPPDLRIELPESIKKDMDRYFVALMDAPDLSLKDFGLDGIKVSDVVGSLRQIYQLPEHVSTEGQ